jgi:SPP1 gp7 family putative phage head morphogenesis protein
MPVTLSTFDAPKKPVVIKKKPKDGPFQKSKYIQAQYERSLRGVAREIGKLIRGYNPTSLDSVEKLRKALKAYSELIDPWARWVVGKMLDDAAKQDARSWKEHTRTMGENLRNQILNAPVGKDLELLMAQNVSLIKSLPIEAAERVHKIVIENLYEGRRKEGLIEEILKTENVTRSRATLIARTETARASSSLTQARAKSVGSEGYIWRTSRDLLVRKSHREMNGVMVKWDSPPKLDNMVGHAGCLPNCRCYPEPTIPEG